MGNARNIAFWVVLFLLVLALFNLFGGSNSNMQSRELSYSEFVTDVENGAVSNVTLDGEKVLFRKGTEDFIAIIPSDAKVTEILLQNKVPVRAEQQQQSGFSAFIMTILPVLLLIGVWIFFMNRMQGGGKGGAMGFGKSKAKMLTEKEGRVSFDDVAGIDAVTYTHLRAHETVLELVCRLLLEKKKDRCWRVCPILRMSWRAQSRPRRL